MAKDMMPAFQLYQPASIEDALALLDRFGADGWALAGGHDSFDWFKDRAKRPKAVVDLNGIDGLSGIRDLNGGLEIGALTTLTTIQQNELVRERFSLLADAAGRVASPQIRNVGTVGGNVSQDARCWYYRYGLDCYRAGGVTCYANTPEGQNREHALFGADRCVAVSPSDTAPALVALDATMVVQSSKGERLISAGDFFIGPSTNITQMTVLEPGDILTAIRIPSKWAGANFYFEKVADRNTWDFPLVNIAAALRIEDGVIEEARIVCGAVEAVPRRLEAVEKLVKGAPHNEATAEQAASIASEGAAPLNLNHFKMPLMDNLVKRAIRDA
jgi:xanthine dehydrogenase YagS FAD-binding subunit